MKQHHEIGFIQKHAFRTYQASLALAKNGLSLEAAIYYLNTIVLKEATTFAERV